MADVRLSKMQQVPFLLDGTARVVKAVSKRTTCTDVISRLPDMHAPLAVFLSVDGVERQLPGKTKLLKVWRANAQSKRVEFVIKKSENATTKTIFQRNSLRRMSLNSIKKIKNFARLTLDGKKVQVSDTDTPEVTTKKKINTASEQLMQRLSRRSQTSRVDAFLARTNLEGLSDAIIGTETRTKSRRISFGLKNFTKKKESDKTLGNRTISTGTIRSTDTGYHSSDDSDIVTPNERTQNNNVSTLQTTDDGPLHSTPAIYTRSSKRRTETLGGTLTKAYLERVDASGKSDILKKFMVEQDTETCFPDCTSASALERSNIRCRTEPTRFPAFDDPNERCRFVWNQFCDSDTDFDISDLSISDTFTHQSSNARLQWAQTFDDSYNCLFPDTHNTVDTDASCHCSTCDVIGRMLCCDAPVTDASVDSFMYSRMSFWEFASEDNVLERNISASGEEIESIMSSDEK